MKAAVIWWSIAGDAEPESSDDEGDLGEEADVPEEQRRRQGGWRLYYRNRAPEKFAQDAKLTSLQRFQRHCEAVRGPRGNGLRKRAADSLVKHAVRARAVAKRRRDKVRERRQAQRAKAKAEPGAAAAPAPSGPGAAGSGALAPSGSDAAAALAPVGPGAAAASSSGAPAPSGSGGAAAPAPSGPGAVAASGSVGA